jgi:hypothetical protein
VVGGAVGGFGVVDDRPIHPNNPHFLRACLEQAGQGLAQEFTRQLPASSLTVLRVGTVRN